MLWPVWTVCIVSVWSQFALEGRAAAIVMRLVILGGVVSLFVWLRFLERSDFSERLIQRLGIDPRDLPR